jgi:hypothetical protein
MTHTADSTFSITGWDEAPYNEEEAGPKLTRATISKSFTGDLEGDAKTEYLMMHRADGTATFVGLERITGKLGERSGSFVMRHEGVFEGGAASAECTVVAGSGTGDFKGISGHGSFQATGSTAPFKLTYKIS